MLCFILFSYNAWRCLAKYSQSETVTKTSLEKQELHQFPTICLGVEKLTREMTGKLNITPQEYWDGVTWRKGNMSEEDVFDNLSVGFSDLVEKISIKKTKMKNSGAYDTISVDGDDLEMSGVQLIRSDYYYELKRYCVQFSHARFPYGIQKIDFVMKRSKNVQFFITSPGNAFAEDRKSNEFVYAGGLLKMSIEYTIGHSLSLDRDRCSEAASWMEDDCTLDIVNSKMMDKLNCTAPWLINFARYFPSGHLNCVKSTTNLSLILNWKKSYNNLNLNEYPSCLSFF